MAIAGRALRIKISSDGGTTFVAVEGSTSDNFNITKEGINVTDKDDVGVQTFIDDTVGSWAMGGGFEGNVVNDRLLLLMNDATQFTYDCEILVGGIGTYSGKFGFSEVTLSGTEGPESTTISGSITSSGAITYTAA